MLWLVSNSGINSGVIDLALAAKKLGMKTVAFTSLAHSQSVRSRHASGKRLFEVCDEVVDLGGVRGDAIFPVRKGLQAGPLSTLSAVLMAQSIIVSAVVQLESLGIRCVYTSVNTPEGEKRNRALERRASQRDPLLR
jgi:uncharacterized phosphosugar-binding protein